MKNEMVCFSNENRCWGADEFEMISVFYMFVIRLGSNPGALGCQIEMKFELRS